jgi:hypothetical protein
MPLGRRSSGRQKMPASWECDNKRMMIKLYSCLALTHFQSPFIIISNWKRAQVGNNKGMAKQTGVN